MAKRKDTSYTYSDLRAVMRRMNSKAHAKRCAELGERNRLRFASCVRAIDRESCVT